MNEIEKHKENGIIIDDVTAAMLRSGNTIATREDPELVEKWRPILEQQGITDEYKLKWMAQYCESHMKFEKEEFIDKGVSPIPDDVKQLIQPKQLSAPEFKPILHSVSINIKKIVNKLKRLKKIKGNGR